jgi:hypothetical protein
MSFVATFALLAVFVLVLVFASAYTVTGLRIAVITTAGAFVVLAGALVALLYLAVNSMD